MLFRSKEAKINVVDCRGCKYIPECLQDEVKTRGVDSDVLQLLRVSVSELNDGEKVVFSSLLTAEGICGRLPFFSSQSRHWNACVMNQAVGIPRCLACRKNQQQALQKT